MANACVFCGTTTEKITNEHVFADWISELFGHEPVGTAEMVESDGSIKAFPAVPFQQKVRVVCRPCNEGWMSSLEVAVKDFLGPMLLEGQPTSLSRDEQRALATWTIMTAMMMDHLHPTELVVPDVQFSEFYAAKAPLAGHLVWVGFRERLDDETERELLGSVYAQSLGEFFVTPEVATHTEQWQREGRNVYRITFAIGHVAFQIFGHNLLTEMQVQVPPDAPVHIIDAGTEPVEWPPAKPIESIGGLRGLHDAFG
ncbi:MAG: hypothetical protein ACYDHN_14300 [Solirubrobacteraceae bacterium]